MNNLNEECIPVDSESMIEYYADLHQKGTEFFVDGALVPWRQVMAMAVAEQSDYMADYVVSDEGKITQIRFDNIAQI